MLHGIRTRCIRKNAERFYGQHLVYSASRDPLVDASCDRSSTKFSACTGTPSHARRIDPSSALSVHHVRGVVGMWNIETLRVDSE